MNMWPAIVVFLAASTITCTGYDWADSNVEILARSISHGIYHSDILSKSLPFAVRYPHDMFFRVGSLLLEKAGIGDPDLAELDAAASEKAAQYLGALTSELYIRTVGYETAKFLDHAGLLRNETVVQFAFMVVTAAELEACIIGANDAESFTTAVVYGLFDTFEALGSVSYEHMNKLFHVFADELLLQAGIP